MHPPSSPSSPIDFNNDLLQEIANFDFDTSFMDPLFSPIETTMPQGNNESSNSPPIGSSDPVEPHLYQNTHIPASMHAPTIHLQPNAVTVDNFGLSFADPFAMEDQIQASTRIQTHPINYQSMQNSVTQTLQGIPNELAPQMNFQSDILLQDSLSAQGNYFPGQNPRQPILPSYFSNPDLLIMSNMEQLAPSPSAGLTFSTNALQPPLPPFTSQTVHANYANYENYQPSNYSLLECQLPREEYTPPPVSVTVSSGNNFVSTMDDILSHDPEGIACFLAGIVRPAPGCTIYKCSTCFVEFPTAQAFGGHMKSHVKRKIKKKSDGKAKGKRMKGSTSSKSKTTKAPKKKSCESEEDD